MIRLQVVQEEDRDLLWNINQKYLYEMTMYYPDPMDRTGTTITVILTNTLLIREEKPFFSTTTIQWSDLRCSVRIQTSERIRTIPWRSSQSFQPIGGSIMRWKQQICFWPITPGIGRSSITKRMLVQRNFGQRLLRRTIRQFIT